MPLSVRRMLRDWCSYSRALPRAQPVLWDIEHSLTATRGVGRETFSEYFERVTGQVMNEQATVDGTTEPIIIRETVMLHGLDSDRPCSRFLPAAPPCATCCVPRS